MSQAHDRMIIAALKKKVAKLEKLVKVLEEQNRDLSIVKTLTPIFMPIETKGGGSYMKCCLKCNVGIPIEDPNDLCIIHR